MCNWIDLSSLPHRGNSVLWKECHNNIVEFSYRNCQDKMTILCRKDVDHLLVGFHEKEYILPIVSLQRCSLGKLFGFSVSGNYKYYQNEIITLNDNQYRVKTCIRIKHGKGTIKGYELTCLRCNEDFTVSESNITYRTDGCPYCSHHKIIKGKTDLWSTRPDIAKLLKNKEDGYKYAENSNKSVDFICDKCGKPVGKKIISSVSRRGLSCKFCRDGKSYPNKLMFNLLKVLGESFVPEQTFDWCTFKAYNSDFESFGIYDFVIENKKIIIEMDGGIGHGNGVRTDSRYSLEELVYRDSQKDLLAIKNGYQVIRIDCDYKGKDNRFEICKQSILNSSLNMIYDLSYVDWDYINSESQKSVLYEICQLYNDGYSSSEISEMVGYNLSSVIDYLHKGDSLSLCKFIPQKIRRKKLWH